MLEPKHVQKIGHSIWLFLYLVAKVTKEVDGDGTVLGGKPITDEELSEIGLACRSIRRYRDVLVEGGYISAKRVPHGYIYTVHNSRKFNVAGYKTAEE